MKASFQKYSATGNDFILIDDRSLTFPAADFDFIRQLCARKTGVGADGLILLQAGDQSDFRMRYFNADGHESEMCGNGCRSIMDFAHDLGIIADTATFESMHSIHQGQIAGNRVRVRLNKPENLSLAVPELDIQGLEYGGYVEIGVPHCVLFCEDPNLVDVSGIGPAIAHHNAFARGTNVNFVAIDSDNELSIRTYERGVEAETLACGTGAGASSYISAQLDRVKAGTVRVNAPGGLLQIEQELETGEIWLSGNIERIFHGEIEF